jgi:hypothetical protein
LYYIYECKGILHYLFEWLNDFIARLSFSYVQLVVTWRLKRFEEI